MALFPHPHPPKHIPPPEPDTGLILIETRLIFFVEVGWWDEEAVEGVWGEEEAVGGEGGVS